MSAMKDRNSHFYRSAVGKKAIMAVTGMVLFLYVLVHMLGNLKLFQGAEKLNQYAQWLREVGAPAVPHTGTLWIVRVILLVAFALHVVATIQLTRMNMRARQTRYQVYRPVAAGLASWTMRWTGVLILLFVIFHLLDLTWGTIHPDFEHGNVYHNVVVSLGTWWIAAVYITAQLALGLHLYHGLWSMFQSLGWSHPRLNPWRRPAATTFAVVITAGNILIPIVILLGWVR
jgi:succinate dehydrogenase / fumarate reductase cytochrome b subunit